MAYRERQKISQMTPKGADLEATDLLEVSTIESGSYVTRSITGQEIINAVGSQDLQEVTDIGNTTTNDIIVDSGGTEVSTISGTMIITENVSSSTSASLKNGGELYLKAGAEESILRNINVTNTGVILEFPDKPTGSYTIATEDDLTNGYVPYTGATQDVDLDNNKISARSVYIEGTGGDGHLHLKHQSADATATGQSTSLYADVNGDLKYKNDGDYYTTLKTSSNTADRVYIYPDASGTIALQDVEIVTLTSTLNNLNISHAYKLLKIDVGSANDLRIPTNTGVPFPIGTQILFFQYGAGQVTVAGTAGVTVRSSGGKTKTAAQYAMGTIIKIDTNEWVLAGDLTT